MCFVSTNVAGVMFAKQLVELGGMALAALESASVIDIRSVIESLANVDAGMEAFVQKIEVSLF